MISRVCQVLKATPAEEAELVGAAEFSSQTVRIPTRSAPEVYPMLHRLAATAPALTAGDISAIEEVISKHLGCVVRQANEMKIA